MKRKPQTITDAELAVLKTLWEQGPLTARVITETLYPQCTESDVGTVHSFLQRLERKKFVKRDRGCYPHLFTARVSRTDVAGQQLEAMADKLSDGSLAPFLMHMVQSKRLSDCDLTEIRRLLAKRSPRKGGKRDARSD